MFERFTDRARKAVTMAQFEARNFKHHTIGTEHLLLGLVVENGGVAERALAEFDVDADRLRAAIQERVGPGSSETPSHVPFTPRAKKVLELSLSEALQLGHNYIGTEHILLGLTRAEDENVALELLKAFGADPAPVRREVVRILSEYTNEQVVQEREQAATEMAQAVGQSAPKRRRARRAEPATGPNCPGCGKVLSATARYTTWDVPELQGQGTAPVLFLFCSACGHTIDDVILPSE